MIDHEHPPYPEYKITETVTKRGYRGRMSSYTNTYGVVYRDEGVFIRWTCGDLIGGWTTEQFEDLLKQIAKVPASKGLILPVEVPHYDTYGVMLHEDGHIMYGESVGYVDGHGPSLAELKKALASIKRYIKKQAAQADREVTTV